MTPEIEAKMDCHMIIYKILAKDNSKEYPLMDDDKPINKYSTKDGACTYDAIHIDCSQSGNGPETCKDFTDENIIPKCDCSDPLIPD